MIKINWKSLELFSLHLSVSLNSLARLKKSLNQLQSNCIISDTECHGKVNMKTFQVKNLQVQDPNSCCVAFNNKWGALFVPESKSYLHSSSQVYARGINVLIRWRPYLDSRMIEGCEQLSISGRLPGENTRSIT